MYSCTLILICILIAVLLAKAFKAAVQFCPQGTVNNIPALVQIMAWRRPCDKLLSEPTIFSVLTHIRVSRLQCSLVYTLMFFRLMKCHNFIAVTSYERHCVSICRHLDCLFKSLLILTTKNIAKLGITLCDGTHKGLTVWKTCPCLDVITNIRSTAV